MHIKGASLSPCSTPVVISKKCLSQSGDLTMEWVFCRVSIWNLRLQ